MAIIGISGKIGSGKDTVGRIIQFLTLTDGNKQLFGNTFEQFNSIENGLAYHHPIHKWKIKKFALKLKETVANLTGCTVEDLESQEFKTKQLPEEWGNMTYREMLQIVGTEAMRNNVHENVWVNALFSDYKNGEPFEITDVNATYLGFKVESAKLRQEESKWIITDMRFPNELKAVEDRGGITIRINRFTKEDFNDIANGRDQDQHPSETALDNASFKYTIDNSGTIAELLGKVKEILILEKII